MQRNQALNFTLIQLLSVLLSVFGLTIVTARNAHAQSVAPIRCDAARLASPGTQIKAATALAAGSHTLANAPPLPHLPAFCRVEAVASSGPDSTIHFEVWLPSANWNGKLVATGNGGYSNVLNYGDMAQTLRQGYAVIGGDTGHQTATPDDLLWGAGHPEKIKDWGTRSIHTIAVAAKRIIAQAYGRPARRAYYCGCSTGGHQGYAEMQRYPNDFDGVIAGAPGNNRVRLNVGFLWQFLVNHNAGDNATPIIPAAKLPLITNAIVAACDANDGVSDGVIDDPRTCKFDPSTLLCKGEDNATCLTAPQLAALQKMYAGAKNPRTGETIYPGWPLSSEALTVGAKGQPLSGWNRYWGTTEPTRANFWRYWVFADPNWNWWKFDFDRDLTRADKTIGPLVDQTSAYLKAFQARGGKAIVYQGWQDPVVNALDTIAYYDRVKAQQGSPAATDSFFRLFLVPGMGHCAGGTGATNFGNQGGPAPIVDAEHDLLSALDAWVEKGIAPQQIIASKIVNGATMRTRPLCPYPQKARYQGFGSTDDAANFTCRAN